MMIIPDWKNAIKVSQVLEAKYERSLGEAYSRYLNGLKEKKILGTKCSTCKSVYVPPRIYCPNCFKDNLNWIEVPQEGTVSTAVIVYISSKRERLEKPRIVGVVWLNYVSSNTVKPAIFHNLLGFSEKDVIDGSIIGARVRAKWREESTGSILDIEGFERVV
jgi:Predicted nucleic-acid-binding protein containing a Zn-ribbon